MDLTDLLKGKMVNIMTDAKVIVQLEIESVNENHHSRDLEPSTQANDWWPRSEDWTTIDIKFVNGYTKSYRSLKEIDLVK
jgi:hypothetical protein